MGTNRVLLPIPIHFKNHPHGSRKTGMFLRTSGWHPRTHFQDCIPRWQCSYHLRFFWLYPRKYVSTQVHSYAVLSILPGCILPPVSAPMFHSLCLMYLSIPLVPTASLPLCLWKRSFPSTSTPKLRIPNPTRERMTLILFHPGWQHSTEDFLLAPNVSTSFSHEISDILSLSVSIQSFLFCILFFHSLLIFSINLSEVSTRLYNRTLIWYEVRFHKQLSNLPVPSSKPKLKFSFRINWHGLVVIKPENLGLYQVKNESLTDGLLEPILLKTEC